MKSNKLCSALAAVALATAALPATAQYAFNATEVVKFGGPTYGNVTLTQAGADVDFRVDLRGDMNFLTTGGHNVFAFNGTGVVLSDIIDIQDASLAQTFKAVVPGIDPPFGSFTFGIVCDTGCSTGGSAGGYADPLTFTVQNAVIADFLSKSTGAGSLGPAYFAADVILTSGDNKGATGSIGVTAAVPEPETCALMLAGLGMMGFMARRRQPA
jgi:PEP-CTERM motif